MIFFSLNAAGGSASVFLSLANALQENGHEVDVYTYYWNQKDCFPELTKKLNIRSIKKISSKDTILNNNSILARLLLGKDYYVNAQKLYKLLKGSNYQVIYSSEALAYIPALIYKKHKNVPVVWYVADPISLADNKREGSLIEKYGWFKKILQIHNFFDQKKIRSIDRVIVPTHKMKKQLDSFYGINCLVFPTTGVRIDEFKVNLKKLAEERLRLKFSFIRKNETILLSIGHFLPHRRYEDSLTALVQIVKKNPNVKFIISGSDRFDPQYFNLIKTLVKKLSLEQYVILDTEFKSNNEIIGYYQFSDIFLFVCVEQTWGLAPFEAMACHKPVVISKGVGAKEVLAFPRTIIVEEKSPTQIVDAVTRLIEEKQYYQKVAQTGYLFVKKNFDYHSVAENLVSKLKKI